MATRASIIQRVFYISGPLSFLLALIIAVFNPAIGSQVKVFGIVAWMLLWWITEAVAIPITSLLPLVFFPLLGISSLNETAFCFGHPIIFLFMGGFFIAIALEKWKLHERLALLILKTTGSSEKGVLAGFMISTAFLSMWISNTACTLMMLPIAVSILSYFDKHQVAEQSKLPLTLMLGLSASASIGGFMTLIGTPPNLVMTGMMKKMGHRTPDFAEWLIIAVPIGVIILYGIYLILSRIIYKLNNKPIAAIEESIQNKILLLGKLNSAEKRVIFIFLGTAFLWIFKDSINFLTSNELFNDTNIAMLGGLSLFLIPAGNKTAPVKLLEWDDVQKMPWGILLLFGGGLNVAAAMEKSGLIDSFGHMISNWQFPSPFFEVFLICVFAIFASELMSNVALAAIIIPVIASVAIRMHISPYMLVIPVTMASSCGFMLPIATPPNTIVYSSGRIRVNEMMKTGFWFNLLCALVISLLCHWLVGWVM